MSTTLSDIRLGSRISRRTAATIQSRPVIVELHPGYMDMRQQGLKTRFSLSYEEIFTYAAQRAADKLAYDRKQARKGKR